MVSTSTICDAISRRRIITCTYKNAHRVIVPLLVFETDSREHVLHGWQTGGRSGSGRAIPDWGHFTIADISNLLVTDDTFTSTPAGYNPDRYSTIVCSAPKTH